MRKLKLQMQVTLDGYVAGPNGEMDWVTFNWDDQLNQYVTELTETVDCMLLGRKLAEGFIPHWAALPEGEDTASVQKMNDTTKVVFTDTLENSKWANTVLAKGSLVDEISRLKRQSGQDMITYGGASFASALVKHGLIDEYHLFINPVAIGRGLTIFKAIENPQNLALKYSRAFPCGIVALYYIPKVV